MDEDDSQDELINRSTSHSKGKRAAVWAISDDSDDVEGESAEGESDSGEEEVDDHQDGEDDDDEEEEEEEDEEEEDDDEAKTEDGAFGGTSADLAGLSSDEDSDKCPICLNSFTSQPVGTPESCEHYFCLDCILEWAKNANSCPVDRITFNNIYLRKCYGGKVKKIITVQKPKKEGQEETVDLDLEQTNCEVCGGSDREDRLLLCDGCDAGYHMECLTPPLDAVPVEEWFCPECEANNRQSRGSAEEGSETESLPSSARPATSRSQSRAAGPTRAIARTQQSERVRASVNRHRITQARTSQLAPTYLMQNTWLDETINAVVAGLNTSVYIRNFTPRLPSRRKRKTRRRTKVKSKASSSKNGKRSSTGVKRRKRKVRRTKSKKKLVLTKMATPRSRIANSLGIVKEKKSSSLPTVYRPSEHTLSNMRADIGAASLSIYGDPFDLDPLSDREEEQQQAQVTTLLEAKRRGISHSALRSHQPVARPFTASLSRRGMDVSSSGGVVEAAPVPDLLGSILTGQSMLLMDSSDVVINRDGSLKATKTMMPSASKPGCSNTSGNASTEINLLLSPSHGDSSQSPNRDLPGFSHSSADRSLSQSSSCLPTCTPSSASRTHHPSLQPPRPARPTPPLAHRATNGVPSSSVHPTPDSSSKSRESVPSQSQPKKVQTKPMWVDVSELPRIPKIKRESSTNTNDGGSWSGSSGINRDSRRNHGNNSTTSSNGYMPEMGMNSLAGDKGRQQSVDQQKGRAEGQSHRQRPDGAGSSSAFSNSFSSSSTASPASQQRYSSSSSSSSSSSAVSFRINSSGNSWHSRRLSIGSSSASEDNMQDHWRKKEAELKKRQLHRDKQMLLASHTSGNKDEDTNNIYDPFNPTLSDSSSSDNEAESKSCPDDSGSQHGTHEVKAPHLGKKQGLVQKQQDRIHVKTEAQEIEVSQEEPRRASAQETLSGEVRCSKENIKVEKESTLVDTKNVEHKLLLHAKVKKEPGLDGAKEAEMYHDKVNRLNSVNVDTKPPVHHNLDVIKNKRQTSDESGQGAGTSDSAAPSCKNDSPASSSATTKKAKRQKEVGEAESKSCSKSPSRDLSHKKKVLKSSKERRSSSPETNRGRRGDHRASGQGGRRKEKEKDREMSSRRSRSQERGACSTSGSSLSNSPDKARGKRRRSRSRSKDMRRSRSGSSSSGREHSGRKKHKQRRDERNDGRDCERRQASKDKRHGRSRSRSLSKSRSRSRSGSRSKNKNHKRGRSCLRSRSRSRSRSKSTERRKEHTRSQQSPLSSKNKMESQSKDKRRRRSRSSSSERRKAEGSSSQTTQITSGSSALSKETKRIQDRRKEDRKKEVIPQILHKEENVALVNKLETQSSSVVSDVKKEDGDLRGQSQGTTMKTAKEIKNGKEIKKEKQPFFDIFEDSPIANPIKEDNDDVALMVVKGIKEEGNKDDPIKNETCKNMTEKLKIKTEPCDIPIVKSEPCDIPIIKSEPCSSQLFDLPSFTSSVVLTAPVPAESLKEEVSESKPVLTASVEQTVTAESTVSVKQEVQQPSDSDDDFNVDVMLDNLDYIKSEGTDASFKKEKAPEEGKNDGGEQVSAAVGTKSKTQVKRVTWNIQEPEGPQPEKSASKLALYKLRLKQEGARRPSSAIQTSGQDSTGATIDPPKKGVAGPLSSSSRSDGEGLSTTGQGEVEEDLSRKDQYLKKLHMQERAIEEVKLAIKPFYQRRDINKDEYKEILRKAVQKVCHSKSGEINPVKVGNLVKAYVDKYKHARKHKKGEDSGKTHAGQTEAVKSSDSP